MKNGLTRILFLLLTILCTCAGLSAQFCSTPIPTGPVPITDNAFDPVNPQGSGLNSFGVTLSGLNTSDNVTDISVEIAIDHTFIDDLTAYLVAPNGRAITLFSEPGPGISGTANLSANSPIIFDDDSANDAEDMGAGLITDQAVCADNGLCDFFANADGVGQPPSFAGPEVITLLGLWDGADASNLNGQWNLFVGDGAGFDTGEIVSVEVCVTVVPACSITNFSVTNVRCDENDPSNRNIADISFDVSGGSGLYRFEVFRGGASAFTSFSAGAEDGNVSFTRNINASNNPVVPGEVIMVQVSDVDDDLCASALVEATYVECPLDICEITNVQVTNVKCGGDNNVDSDQTFADISFEVAGGSGDYEVLVYRDGEVVTANDLEPGEATDGTVNTGGQLTFAPAEPGEMVQIQIIDQGNDGCSSELIDVEILECPPCELVCEPNVTVELDGNGQATITAMDLAMSTCDDMDDITLSQTDFTCADIGSVSVTVVQRNVTVQNNDFATRNLSSWTEGGNDRWLVGGPGGNNEFASVQFDGASNNTLSQTLTGLTVGETYTVSFLAGGNDVSAGSTTTLSVEVDGTEIFSQTADFFDANDGTGSAYSFVPTPFTATFTATATSEILTFRAVVDANSFDDVQIDDIAVEGASCQSTVVVADNTPPVLECQDIMVELPASGNDTIVSITDLRTLAVTSISDNCGSTSGPFIDFGESARTFGCSQVGQDVTVMLVTNDGNGNSTRCAVSVTVEDNTPPVITCEDIVVELGANGTVTYENGDPVLTVSDNCSAEEDLSGPFTVGGPTRREFTCDSLGMVFDRTVVYTDESGNRGECDYQVRVVDPTLGLDCDEVVEVMLDEDGTVVTPNDLPNPALTSDICTDFSYLGGPFTMGGMDARTFTCDSLGKDITVRLVYNDPSIDRPNKEVIGCDYQVVVVDPTLELDCEDVVVQLDAEGNLAAGPNTVWDADLQKYLLANDASNPVLSSDACPDNFGYLGGPFTMGGPDARMFGCKDVNPVEPIMRTVVYNDDALPGLNKEAVSCTYMVTVEDKIGPVIECSDVTVVLDENGQSTKTEQNILEETLRVIENNCGGGILVISNSLLTPSCGNVGTNPENIQVQDDNGNPSNDCQFNIIVIDDTDPVARCQDVEVVLDVNGNGSTIAGAVDDGSSDACGIKSLALDVTDFNCDDVGPNPVVLTVTDNNDNTSTCDATVTVIDNIPPVITLINPMPRTIVLDDEGLFTLPVSALATATDACGVESLTAVRTGLDQSLEITEEGTILNFTCEDIGENIFEITATDVNGNSSTAEATVIVDFEQPLFACISELNLTLNENCTAELIPRMFLTGDVACLDEFPMLITVMDDDPTNGGIIDGCGTFQFKVESVGTGVLDLDFETCWGVVNAEDKTPPAVVTTPRDAELPCTDFEEIMLTMLDVNISRCWIVERVTMDDDNGTENGTGDRDGRGSGRFVTVEGTMAEALRDRLDLIAFDAGAGTAIVPEFTDGCAPRLQVCVNDVATFDEEDPECEDVVITRTFTATELDNCENAAGEENGPAVTSFDITFVQPTLADVEPDGDQLDVAEYECDENLSLGANGNPVPRPGDIPFFSFGDREIPLVVNGTVCNIGLTYEDGPRIVTCPNTYKFVRTYTVIDWCAPIAPRTYTQVVKVGDTTAPDFTGPVQDRDFDGTIDGDGTADNPLIFSTNAGDICAAYIRLDDPTITLDDNCSAGIELKVDIYPFEVLTGAPIGTFFLNLNDGDAEVAGPVPAGRHIMRYTFTDDCGNSDFEDLVFEVVDRTAPVAICEDGLNISLTSGGTTAGPSTGVAVVTPEMIDNGSYDDCGEVTLHIGRVRQLANGTYELLPGAVYTDELLLDCNHLGNVLVGLRVTDEAGNVNYCWLEVLVEDKARPVCFAPAPINISCIAYNAELPADINEATDAELDAAFGAATGIDNCEVTITQTIDGDVNSCGVGSFTRVFTATDGQPLTNAAPCTQRIEVYGIYDYTLTFPQDAEALCMEDPVYEGIGIEERACDLITINPSIDTFRTQSTASDECFKLEITYDIINWCEYNSIGQAYLIPRDREGLRDPETQDMYLHVRPGLSETTTTDDVAWLSNFADLNFDSGIPQFDILLDNGDDVTDGDDDDNGNDNIDEDAYAADDSRGFFRYVQFVKIYDEVEPVVNVTEPAECFAGIGPDDCVAEVTLTFEAFDLCSDVSVSVELDADYAGTPTAFERTRFLTTSEVVANGDDTYTVRLSGIPVGEHALRIRAGDGCGNFDVDILEFCVTADKAPTPICIQTLTVTLMPDGNGGGMAAIWATDFIASEVADCFGNVIDEYSIYTEEEATEAGFEAIAGRIGIDLTCEDFGEDVNVRVYAIDEEGNADYCSVVLEVQAFQEGLCEGSSGSLSGLITTQETERMSGVAVTLTGDNAMDETVTTDANGQFAFTNLETEVDYTASPEYEAAFDFGRVTITDIVAITNHILGSTALVTGYDHVAADVNLDADVNIFDLVAMRRVILGLDNDLNAVGATWRFVEADYNLTPGNWMLSFPEVYNVNNLAGNVTDADFVGVELGNVVRSGGRAALELKVRDAELAAGQTHTLELTSGELAGFQGTLELAAGLELVNVSYEGEGAMNLNRAGEGLLAMAFNGPASITLEVRATEATLLSEALQLTDAITVREGVVANGTAGTLSLNFAGLEIAEGINALRQNSPNPVTETTLVRFELARAGTATLTLRDAAGRVVLVRELDAVAGANQLELTRSDLGASGVLTYTLTAGDFTATKKMVVVRR